jgi:FG-GAP-like repeat
MVFHPSRRSRTSFVPLCSPRHSPPIVEALESRLAPSANVAITTNPGVQQMPSIAVDPLDPDHLVTAYMDYSLLTTGYAGIGVAVSENDGATWKDTSIPLPAPFNQGAATPTAKFNAQGQVFVSFAAATFLGPLPPITDPNGGSPRALGFQSNNGVFVASSDDGGLTWNPPVAVASNLYDGVHPVNFELKPDLAIDTFSKLPNGQPNPYFGSLYVSWSHYYTAGQFPGEPTASGGSDIMIAVSRDDGQTWQTQLEPQVGTGIPVSVLTGNGFGIGDVNTGVGQGPGLGYGNWSQVTVGPLGDIYVIAGTGQSYVFHSTDGGASFTGPNSSTYAGEPFRQTSYIPASTLTNDQFRTQHINDVVADPARPGYVYAINTQEATSGNGTTLDPGDIFFARSTDYGVTWQNMFQVGPYANASVLNDDNFGNAPTGTADDVDDGHAQPQLAIDADGDIGVIWYDTRRDPNDTNLDVYGTISTDGGQTFSSNFRITDQSFNPNAGAFTDATGQIDYYLGDRLGLAMANGTAYATWTDTRNGNQDIYFSSFPISPPPTPSTNRFGPNNTPALATDLGQVLTRSLPKLTIGAGDEEWFQLQAAATGNLTVSAALATPGDGVRLDLFDASGTTLLATGTAVLNASGQVAGQSLTFPGQENQTYLVEVLPGPAVVAGSTAAYTLNMQSLTADLGDQVSGVLAGSLTPGSNAYYALTAPAAGSLEVILTPGTNAIGNFHVTMLDQGTLSELSSGQTTGTAQLATLTVTPGQAVYLHVYGDAGAQGNFSLQFTNLDQFTAPDNTTLFFPTGGNPGQMALADLTGNGRLDIVVDYTDQNFVSVLLSNGDGTFQAARDYAVGPFFPGGLNSSENSLTGYRRAMAIADFTGDGIPDIAVVNYQSNTISLLLGRGDGTFEPQRIIGLGSLVDPYSLAAGDLTNDGKNDLVVVSSIGTPTQVGEVLLGNGNGTFGPPIPFTIPDVEQNPTDTIQIADLTRNGIPDLVYEGLQSFDLLGNGDGTFQPATPISPLGNNGQGALLITDLNGDGNLDVITTSPVEPTDNLQYELGNGDGTFGPQTLLTIGDAPVAVAVAELGSQVTLPDGSTVLGPPDGIPDLVVADNGLVLNVNNGPAQIVIVPGLDNAQGQFIGFGSPITLAPANAPLDLKVADLTGDGTPDILVAEAGGIEVIYGKPLTLPPNTTPKTARNLGTVVHLVEPTQTIVPGHEDAYYTLTVPTEAAKGAGDEILDFSGLFQGLSGAGIAMEVTDAAGNVLGSGERFQIKAPQGAVLTLHVYGVFNFDGSRGTGAYTLDVDVLPQVVSIAAEAFLPSAGSAPGGPTTSLVITFQGDRLDPATAEDAANYSVIWLGANGNQVIPLTIEDAVYDPSSNVDVASGVTYATAVRQTVTLLFDEPLPVGSYRIELAPAIQAAPFSNVESDELSSGGFTGHAVASLVNGAISAGDIQTVPDLVSASVPLDNLAALPTGTPFLTQLHDDLGAILDAELTVLGDDPSISTIIDSQIAARFAPALGAPDERPTAVLVIWLDPVIADLKGSKGQASYNPQTNSYQNTFSTGFVSVAGNVELLVLPFVPSSSQSYALSIVATPDARGGVVYVGTDGYQTLTLTPSVRNGMNETATIPGDGTQTPSVTALPSSGQSGMTLFQFLIDAPALAGPPQPTPISVLPTITPRATSQDSTPVDNSPGPQSSIATLLDIRGTPSGQNLVTTITPLPNPSQTASQGFGSLGESAAQTGPATQVGNSQATSPIPQAKSSSSMGTGSGGEDPGAVDGAPVVPAPSWDTVRPLVDSMLQVMKRVSGVANPLTIQLLDEVFDSLKRPPGAGPVGDGPQSQNQRTKDAPAAPSTSTSPVSAPGDVQAQTSLDALDCVLLDPDLASLKLLNREFEQPEDTATTAGDGCLAMAFLTVGAYRAGLRLKDRRRGEPDERRAKMLNATRR